MFLWTAFHVNHVDASIDFFKEVVGLILVRKVQVNTDRTVAFLKDPESDTQIELISDGGSYNQDTLVSVAFKVKDLDVCIEKMNRLNIDIVVGPIMPKGGVSFIFVKDPNGIMVQFVELLTNE